MSATAKADYARLADRLEAAQDCIDALWHQADAMGDLARTGHLSAARAQAMLHLMTDCARAGLKASGAIYGDLLPPTDPPPMTPRIPV